MRWVRLLIAGLAKPHQFCQDIYKYELYTMISHLNNVSTIIMLSSVLVIT